MATLKQMAMKLSVKELQEALEWKKRQEKIESLELKRVYLAAMRERIQILIDKLDKEIVKAGGTRTIKVARKTGKRKLSPASRAKIVAAQNRRWAKYRKAKAAKRRS